LRRQVRPEACQGPNLSSVGKSSELDVRAAGEHEREKRAHGDQNPLAQLHALPPPSPRRPLSLSPSAPYPLCLALLPTLGDAPPNIGGHPIGRQAG
jgi:hypothetical protein